MPKLPDDLDLKGVQYQAVRPFVAIPQIDYSGAQVLSRALSNVGDAVSSFAQERRTAAANTEILNGRAGLIEAKGQFELEKAKLDPLQDDYPEQVRQLWIKTVDPLVNSTTDPEAKLKIGGAAKEELASAHVSAMGDQQKAREEDQVGKLKVIGDDLAKKLHDGADIETVRKDFVETVNGLPYVAPARKKELIDTMLPALDKEHVNATANAIFTGKNIPVIVGNQPGRVSKGSVEGLRPEILSTWQRTQNVFGRPVRIVSGYRDAATNAAAGGAQKSQHLHGNAIDIDVSDMPISERQRLIEVASANGFTGIGVYKNSLHFDLGTRRVWGAKVGVGKYGPPAAWGAEAAMRHMVGKSRPMGGLPRTGAELWSRLEAVESGGDQGAISPKGARGVAQIMPATAPEAARYAGLEWDEALFNGSGPESERYNRALGQAYFKEMLRQFGGDPTKALAAYNAGPGATKAAIAKHGDAWLSKMPQETQDYVSKIAYGGKGVIPEINRGYDPTLRQDYVESIKALPSFQRLTLEEQKSTLDAVDKQLTELQKDEDKAYTQSLADAVFGQSKVSDPYLGEKIDAQSAYAMADRIEDPEKRKTVKDLIDKEVTRQKGLIEQADKEEGERVYDGVIKLMGQGDERGAQELINGSKLSMKDKRTYSEIVNKGLVTSDNATTYQKIVGLYVGDQAAFLEATKDMRPYLNSLTADTVLKIKGWRDTLTKAASGDKVAEAQKQVVTRANDNITAKLKEIGVDPDAKAGKSDAKYANFIRDLVVRRLETFAAEREASGKPILDSDINDAVNEVFKSYPRAKPTGWWKPDTDVDILEVSKEFDAAGFDINQAADALRSKNKPVTPDALLDLLERAKAAK